MPFIVQNRAVKFFAIITIAALTLCPIFNIISIVATTGANNLSNDYLRFAAIVDLVLNGTYDWRNYFRDTFWNGHSLACPVLVYLGVAKLAHWNVYVEMYIGVALFALNTYFWLPQLPHGTDAGYWIPYLTGRQTTVGTMLISLKATEYKDNIVQMSRAVERLEIDNTSLAELQAMGVDYVYIGRRGDFSGPGLNAVQSSQAENVQVLYQNAGVTVLQIKSLPGTN